VLRIYWRLSECDIVLLLLRCDYFRSWRVVIILPSLRNQQLVGCVAMSKRFLSTPPVRSTARAIDHSPGSVMWKRQTDCSASRSTPEARLTLFVYMQLRSIGLSTEGDSKENLLLIYLPSRTLSCSVSSGDCWYLTDKILFYIVSKRPQTTSDLIVWCREWKICSYINHSGLIEGA